MEQVRQAAEQVIQQLEKAIYGKRAVLQLVLTCLLADGHLLLEDVPGTAKTLLAKALAKTLGGTFRRLQCTPDLLPGDVTGSSVFNQKTGDFQFHPGPVFTQILLADEVNRATPPPGAGSRRESSRPGPPSPPCCPWPSSPPASRFPACNSGVMAH